MLFSCKVVSLLPPHETVASQAPLSTGFSRQEYWIGLPFPSPGHPRDAGMKPTSSILAGGFLTTEPPGKPCMSITSQHTGQAGVRRGKPSPSFGALSSGALQLSDAPVSGRLSPLSCCLGVMLGLSS